MNSLIVTVLMLVAVSQAKINWDTLQQYDLDVEAKDLLGFKPRVVGGEEAVPHSFAYQAALFITLNNGDNVFCGGSLISRSTVLTAAHCADGVKSIDVVLGAHNIREEEETQLRITSTDFLVHPKWSRLTLSNDIALIRLPQAVELNENIQVINVPMKSDEDNRFVKADATVSGWGKDSDSSSTVSPVLRYVSNPVITNLRCSLSYPFILKSSHMCVSGKGGKSSCNGDSGGPLTTNIDGRLTQIGLVSFGRATGCARGSPAVYTRLTSYLDWLAENAGVPI